jgi:predicted nucleic acid-binding protein
MDARALADTNVLVYLFDADSPKKRAVARAIIDDHVRRGTLAVSAQVLGEFYVTVTRKFGRKMTASAARAALQGFAELPFLPVEAGTVLAAARRAQAHVLSFWDALLIETALAGGCAEILTEDLQDGRDFDGLKIRDPFRSARGP